MRIVRNRIEPGADGTLRAVATDVEEVIPCGLVIRSIGYRGDAARRTCRSTSGAG